MATKAKIAQTVKAEMNNETVVGINADEIKTEEESTGKRLGIVSKLWSNKQWSRLAVFMLKHGIWVWVRPLYLRKKVLMLLVV